MDPPNRNAIWHLHCCGDRIARSVSDIPFRRIEQRLIGRVLYERLQFKQEQDYWPHLRRPRSFSEKVAHRKLFEVDPLHSLLADKWAVRDYVRAKVGDAILNTVYCAVDDPAELSFTALPKRFVLKATHGSGMNIFIEDKASADLDAVRRECRVFLDTVYGGALNELHYASIPRRIIAERYLSDAVLGVPPDHKLFMFHGICHYIQVDMNRFTNMARRFFDPHWRPQPFALRHPLGTISERPANLGEMIAVAEKLSEGLDFVRVDLYSINGREVVFGEMTLAPGAGWARFSPREYDFRLGVLW
jgi:hypothetical protein